MTEDAWRDWHALPSSAAFLKTTAELDRTRDPKWSKMVHPVSGLEKMGATARSRALLKKRVRKGVPRAWRTTTWPLLLEVAYGSDRAANEGPDHYRRASAEAYPALVSRSSQDPVDPESIYEIIERDLTRTYPRHPMFETALVDGGRSDQSVENKGVSMLRRVLCAYAALDEECGYCQGMNYVAALALVHVCGEDASRNDPMRSMSKRHLGAQASERDLAGSAEEDCFWFLVALLRSRRTSLRELYLPGMVGAQRCLFVYGAVLAQRERVEVLVDADRRARQVAHELGERVGHAPVVLRVARALRPRELAVARAPPHLLRPARLAAVSYTHLTLPTILLV